MKIVAPRKPARITSETQDVAQKPTLTAEVDLTNLSACTEDARVAALDLDPGPPDPTNYHELRGRLEAAKEKLPPIYRDAVLKPYSKTLDEIGPIGFTEILLDDPERERGAGLMLDIAHAILQNGEGFLSSPTDAFQEVVSDLYDGFLSAEDRRGINPPDKGILPPLVKWGNPTAGPYTWPGDATEIFGVRCAIVSLPPTNSRQGLLAWAALGHETGGHDIIHADTGLERELADAVRSNLEDGKLGHLSDYWAERIDETASDVLGILNMGPTAGVGLIGYFRGLNAAFGGTATLRNEGHAKDPHPADIVRGYLAASTVALLRFGRAGAWSKALEKETDKDAGVIRLAGSSVSKDEAKNAARLIAEALVQTKMNALENHSLGEIQNWRDEDEEIVSSLRETLTCAAPLPDDVARGIYAAHAVAAAVSAAIAQGSDAEHLFGRMATLLKTMHDTNPAWGPLFVRHPGNLVRHVAFVR